MAYGNFTTITIPLPPEYSDSNPFGWNKSTHPYVAYRLRYNIDAEDWHHILAICSSEPFERAEYKDGCIDIVSHANRHVEYAFFAEQNTWSWSGASDELEDVTSRSGPVLYDNGSAFMDRLVVNHDVYDSDGNLCIPAYKPMLRTDQWIEDSFKLGIVVGMATQGIVLYDIDKPVVPDEPVAASRYLYGIPSESGNIGLRNGESVTYYDGAVLPKLPETDLPYSLIHKSESANDYYFIASEKAGEVYNTFSSILDPRIEIGSEYTTHRWKSWKLSEGTTEWAEYRNSDNWYYENFKADTLVWTNFDMYYMDSTTVKEEQRGTLYVNASSDPVPVSGVVVGYSYNGTVLPELPESDLQYAFITNRDDGYRVIFMSDQPTVNSLGISIRYENATTANYRHNGTEWVYDSGGESNTGSFLIADTIWGNVDVEKNDMVYFAKSDPIPVYE